MYIIQRYGYPTNTALKPPNKRVFGDSAEVLPCKGCFTPVNIGGGEGYTREGVRGAG